MLAVGAFTEVEIIKIRSECQNMGDEVSSHTKGADGARGVKGWKGLAARLTVNHVGFEEE